MEAFRFMHRSKRKQYTLYPLLSFFLLAAPFLVLTISAHAQTSTTNTVPEPQTLTPAPQAAPPAAATTSQTNQSAAARVRARRQQRIDAIIKDIYGHKYEFFAGYGYLRFRPGDTLQHTSESAWDVGFTDYLKPKLGIVGDFRGYYGTTYTYNNEFQIFQPSISQYMYLFGAQYRRDRKAALRSGPEGNGGLGARQLRHQYRWLARHADRTVSERKCIRGRSRHSGRLSISARQSPRA